MNNGWRKANKNYKFSIGIVLAWGDVAACLFMTPLSSPVTERCESSIRKRKLQFSSNSLQIALSSLTHRVPWIIEKLDTVDSWCYPWFYRVWPPKESIGKTDRFLACSSSDISEEMIKSSFLERFKIMMFLRYFFVITSSVLFPLFFFYEVQSKIGVHNYTRVNTVTSYYGNYKEWKL